MQTLRVYGENSSDFGAAELILAELVGNLVRHAPGRVKLRLQWDERYPTLHTFDHGGGFTNPVALPVTLPQNPFEGSGRGLFIVAALGSNFAVDPVPGLGTHVHVTLPVAKNFPLAGSATP